MNADDIFNNVMSKDDNPGRGKQQCPNCQQYTGVRSYKCDCGHRFVSKKTKQEKQREENAPSDEEKLYAMSIGSHGGRLVYAGSGNPTVRLTSITKDNVFDYCDQLIFEGFKENKIYTVQAIKLYLQHQFGSNSDKYSEACQYVNQWYNEKLGIDVSSVPQESLGETYEN